MIFKIGDKVRFTSKPGSDGKIDCGTCPYIVTAVKQTRRLSYVGQFVELNNLVTYYNTILKKI